MSSQCCFLVLNGKRPFIFILNSQKSGKNSAEDPQMPPSTQVPWEPCRLSRYRASRRRGPVCRGEAACLPSLLTGPR